MYRRNRAKTCSYLRDFERSKKALRKTSLFSIPATEISPSLRMASQIHREDEYDDFDEEEEEEEEKELEEVCEKGRVGESPIKAVMMKMKKGSYEKNLPPEELPFVMVHLYLTRPVFIARSRRKVSTPAMLNDIWRNERDAYFHVDARESTFEVRTFSRTGDQCAELVHSESDDEDNEQLMTWYHDSGKADSPSTWDSGVHSQTSSRKSSSTVVHEVLKDRYGHLS